MNRGARLLQSFAPLFIIAPQLVTGRSKGHASRALREKGIKRLVSLSLFVRFKRYGVDDTKRLTVEEERPGMYMCCW